MQRLSRLGVHHDVGDSRHGLAHALLDRARPRVGLGEGRLAAEPEREEGDEAVVGPHEAKLAGSAPVSSRTTRSTAAASTVDLLARRRPR